MSFYNCTEMRGNKLERIKSVLSTLVSAVSEGVSATAELLLDDVHLRHVKFGVRVRVRVRVTVR